MRWWITAAVCLVACGGDEGAVGDLVASGNPLSGPGSATHPAVAPNGEAVAFMSNMVGVLAETPINFEIYLADMNGRSLRRLTDNDVFDADIAWAPNGRSLAYKSYRDGNDEIYLLTLDGEDLANLTMDPSSDFQPHFSPDGTRLAFGSDRSGTGGLYVLELETGLVETLRDSEADESAPRWSPDGSMVAFVSGETGDDNIFVMDTRGTSVRQLTESPKSDWSPRWSPDGSALLYISGSFDDDVWDLYRVDVATGDAMLVVEGVDSGNADWSPSGDRIFFGRYVDGESRLFTASADGSGIQPFPTR